MLGVEEKEEAEFRTTLWCRIRDAQAGRSSALNGVLRRYRPAIVNFVRRLDRDPPPALGPRSPARGI